MSNLESTTSFLLNNKELIYKNTHSHGEAIVLRAFQNGLQRWADAADQFVTTRYAPTPSYYGNTGYYRGYNHRR